MSVARVFFPKWSRGMELGVAAYLAQPDDVLLKRFADEGDEGAFAELVRRHAGMVFAACRRVLAGDSARAEDVAQETFLRLLRKPHAVTQSVSGWLYTAATQLAIDAARSESARRHREAAYVEEQRQLAPEPVDHSWKEISPHLDAALMELPEDVRGLLVAHFLEGRSQTELAKEYGTSISTVSRHIRHGLDVVRNKLGRKGIVIGALVLAECLALDSVEAAPPGMMAELGKMSMLSGIRGPLPAAPAAAAAGTAPVPHVSAAAVKHQLIIMGLSVLGAAALGAMFMMAYQRSQGGRPPLIQPPAELRRPDVPGMK